MCNDVSVSISLCLYVILCKQQKKSVSLCHMLNDVYVSITLCIYVIMSFSVNNYFVSLCLYVICVGSRERTLVYGHHKDTTRDKACVWFTDTTVGDKASNLFTLYQRYFNVLL